MYRYFSLLALLCSTIKGFDFKIGVTKPIGFFDPLGLSHDLPMSELVRFREAELKHCRVGMIAAVAIPATELVTHETAIQQLNSYVSVLLIVVIYILECRSLFLGWNLSSDKLFVMKEDYQPGDLMLGLDNDFFHNTSYMANAELNNGRLAMIAATGMLSQEFVSNTPIVEVFLKDVV